MLRSGCISIVVLIVLGFAFDFYRSELQAVLARRWASVEKQLQAVHYGCPSYPRVVLTRLRGTGSGNMAALKRDLTNVAKKEFDRVSENSHDSGDFWVVVETDPREHPTIVQERNRAP